MARGDTQFAAILSGDATRMMACMEEDWNQRLIDVEVSQVPVTLSEDWLIIEDESCVAWVDSVQLYRQGARITVAMIFSERLQQMARHVVRTYRWYRDDEVDVTTEFSVDGSTSGPTSVTEPFESVVPPLVFTLGGSGRSRKTESSWWLPVTPSREVTITLSWPAAGVEGSLRIDTSRWGERAMKVRHLGVQ